MLKAATAWIKDPMDANQDLVNTSQDALLDGLSILLKKN